VPDPPQVPSTARPLAEELDRADLLAQQRQGEEARKIYEEAAVRARAEKDAIQESRALAGIGRLLSFSGRYVDARKYLEQAIALSEAAGDSLGTARVAISLGIVAEGVGQPKDARSWYEKAVRSSETAQNPKAKATALFNLARLNASTPEFWDQIRDVAEIAHDIKDTALEAQALHSWGDALFSTQGDFASAMEKLESAAALFTGVGDWDSLARVYTSMGRLARAQGHPEQAIPLYDKARQIQLKTGDKFGVIQSINATGVAYDALRKYPQAREFYERAYKLALETKSPRVIDFMRGNLAGSRINSGDYASGAELLEQLLATGAEANPAVRHSQLATAYFRMGRLPDAREHVDKSIALSANNPTGLVRALPSRAEIREQQGDIAGALSDAREAIRITEEMRAKLVPLDFIKQGFSAYYQGAYTELINLHFRQGEPEKALETAELARARAFLDLLATKDVRLKTADQPELGELRRTEQGLRAQGIDPSAADYRRPPPFNLSAEAQALLQRWTAARPEVMSFVTASPEATEELAETAKRLRSTILSYWTGENALYIWVVPPGGKVEMRRVEMPRSRIESLIDGVTDNPAGRPAAGPVTRGPEGQVAVPESVGDWRELYRCLIQPVRKLLPNTGRLTVIPHGPLLRLPFAALVDDKGRYLLEDYAVHYAPAGALLQFTAAKGRHSGERRKFLFVADPQLPPPAKGDPALPALPGAREEVQSIARLLPAGGINLLLGPSADEQSVTASMVRASVLHFATHGVTLDDQPLNSYLALGRSGASTSDGRLTAEKLYSIDLHADLVVLSSCYSGGGMATGDGISALARAFFYAGTPSIIASLWKVPDRPSDRLLLGFYSAWLKGRSRLDALRAAQLQVIADLRGGRVQIHTPAGDITLPEHPLFWAGFVLLGEP
jgi:CHAT domain-containing protein/tetratricopeptide (TPR) repeat protein